MPAATKRQKEVFDFIADFIQRNGYRPSYQVVARRLGLSSKAGIARHIRALEDQGLLTRDRANGGFRLAFRDGSHEADSREAGSIEWLDTPGIAASENRTPLRLSPAVLGELDPKALFAFLVPDNGLSGRNIVEGDIVIAERRGHARDGDCVVVTIGGRETLLRRLFRDASRVELRPANDDFQSISLPANTVQIEGIYRALIRPAA